MLEDTVRLPPEMLDPDDIEKVITDQLNITYSNKIIENLGMCILVHGIEDAKPAFLYAGDGGAHMRVKFRMVVFRPFEGMVIEGSIMQQDKTGIMVGLQFFDFIFIPAENMRENCSFKAESNQWVWEYAQGRRRVIEHAHKFA